MEEKRNIVFTNDVDLEEFKRDNEEFLEGKTDDQIYQDMCNAIEMDFEAEMENLKTVTLDEEVLLLADLGLWDGRHKGIKVLSRSLNDVLASDCDYVTWYCDEKDFKCKAVHHDGTNYYTYRQWKPFLTKRKKDNFIKKYMEGKATDKDIKKYTLSLRPKLQELYGWE